MLYFLIWDTTHNVRDYLADTNDEYKNNQILIYPEEVIIGHVTRFIAHKRLNRHLARVIYEYENETVVVITFYISHVNRYFRGGIYEDKILP